MPKTEATNWRLISKSTAHIGSRKQLLLLVVSVTMHSRLGGYYKRQEVFMYAYHKLVAKNRKPQIDGRYEVKNLHI